MALAINFLDLLLCNKPKSEYIR